MKKVLDIAVLCGIIWFSYWVLTSKPNYAKPPVVDTIYQVDMSSAYQVSPSQWEKSNTVYQKDNIR